ncbi:MAG: imidazole glycerol phosphate synthase subunit HisH [Deltaproteobacteria bacterium]|nr:imidazole glycerol phosphate synthase subunit HisH [Deltaproteobacteria bacterium]
MGLRTVVVATGTANLASVLAGLRRAGAEPVLASQPDEVLEAQAVVLPGVGTLAAAMEKLRADGMAEALRERVAAGRPTLSVCLGLQLLGTASEESPGVAALGIVEGIATRYPETVRVPQMGWNRVEPDRGCRLLRAGWAYFANSYRLVEAPPGWNVAWSDHAGRFVAAMEKGAVLACQFHPELSGELGRGLLSGWVEQAARGGA